MGIQLQIPDPPAEISLMVMWIWECSIYMLQAFKNYSCEFDRRVCVFHQLKISLRRICWAWLNSFRENEPRCPLCLTLVVLSMLSASVICLFYSVICLNSILLFYPFFSIHCLPTKDQPFSVSAKKPNMYGSC